MRRPDLGRRVVSLVVGAGLLLSVATPARAQFDPITMSLLIGAVQLAAGIGAAITMGMQQDGNKKTIPNAYGTPCGIQDGVPQVCWSPYNGGFEGSPDLPTGAKPFTAPKPAPPPIPMLELDVKPVDPPSPATSTPPAGQ